MRNSISKISRRLLSLLLSVFMAFTMILEGSGGVATKTVNAKEIGLKNEEQQKACLAVSQSNAPEGYSSVLGDTSVYRGGDSYSKTASFELDTDVTDFAKPLPYGDTFVDTKRLNWNTPENFVIDIQDDRFVWVNIRDEPLKDAQGHESTNDPYGEGRPLKYTVNADTKKDARAIWYVGPLKSYHDDIKDAADNDGYTNVIEPEDGKEYLYRITYFNAVTLPNGTRGNLVLTMKKIQIETSVTVDEDHPYILTDANGNEYSYTKAFMKVQGENQLSNDTGYEISDSEGNDFNQRNTELLSRNEALELYDYYKEKGVDLGDNWKQAKTYRNAMGNILDLDIEVVDVEGNPVNGIISYAAHDLDFESAQNIWGRPVGYEFGEGLEIVSGSKSYALVPTYNHLDKITRNEGWLPVGPGEDQLDSALKISKEGDGENADGVRFGSPFLLNFRNADGTLDNAIYSNTAVITYQGDSASANNNLILNKYPEAGNNTITNVAKRQLYVKLKEAGYTEVSRWQDVTPEMAWEKFDNVFWKTYRNDSDESFDSGFAVLLDAKKSQLRWTGSRVTHSNINTTLFDSSIFTYVETTHGTGGGIYLEKYDINNGCKATMIEGTVTMARHADTTVTAVPEDGYRVNRILIGNTNYGKASTESGLSDFVEYVIDGNDIKVNGTVVGTFAGDGRVEGFDALKTGKVEVDAFNYGSADGSRQDLSDKKIVIERNADGTVDVTLVNIDDPMHVHADFGADYYFYKVWEGGDPVELNMTAAPAGFYPTEVTIPVPSGEVDDEGKPIYQDVTFEISGNKYTAKGGTYKVGEDTMDLYNLVFTLTPSNTLEYAEINEETGEEILGIRPNVVLLGENFVHYQVDPDTGESTVDAEYPITIEERIADWEGSDAKDFKVNNTAEYTTDGYVKEYGKDATENKISPGNVVWKIRYPSEGVEALGWPALPVEAEPANNNHDASNHVERYYWFAVEEVPAWSTESYSNKQAVVPGRKTDDYYHDSNWYASTIAGVKKANKLVHEEYEYGNVFMSVFEKDVSAGIVTNVPSIVVRGKKIWNDENNKYNNRKDIWLHLDSQVTNADGSITIKKDVLPAQKVAANATGNGLIKSWGEKKSYATGVSTVKVVATVKKVPSNAKKQADGSYKLKNTYYWVNELSKEDANGNVYEYSIRETLDREGNIPVEKDNIDAGLLGYTSKDAADWSELSTEKTDSSKFAGKDTTNLYGQTVDRYSGEVENTLETVDYEAEKIWDDNNDQDGYRTDITLTLEGLDELPNGQSKTFEIKKDATGDDLKTKWTNLPAYKDCQKVTYSVTESGYDADHYSVNEEVGENKTTFTNVHIPETASISIFKKWDDADNQDGLRKEAAKVLLEGKTASESQYKSVSDQEGNGIVQGTVPVEDGLVITWLNVPVKRNGEDITYKIHEDVAGLGGYYTDPTYVDEEFTLTNGENKEATITNKETPEVTEITVTKEWDDMDDHDGIRPDSVTVKLNKTYQAIVPQTKEVDKQVTVNGEKYDVKVTSDGTEYFVIDGKYYSADDITDTDADVTEYSELRPFNPTDSDEAVMKEDPADEALEVEVDGTTYAVKVDANGVKYYSKDGKYYEYLESGDGEELTPFAATADDETAKVEVVDEPQYEEKTEVVEEITLSESNGWTKTVSDLPVNAPEGQKITYSVSEDDVPEGYEATVTSTEPGKYTVTNKHEVTINPPVGEPEVTEDYKGKPQTSPVIKFTPDPDTLGPGGTENKIERVTLVDEDGNEVNTVTVPGEGTYVLNDDGTITFTPEPDFVGKTSGVKVRGYDSNGLSADTTYTPTVKHKVKYVDPLNPDGEQVVEGPRDCNTPDASDDSSNYEDAPGTESKNHPGYRFDGWDEEEIDDPDHPGDKITVRTAKYTPMYNINYDPNGGEGEMEDNNYMANDSSMPHDKNTFTRKGYTFEGFKAYITDPTTGEETPIVDENGDPIIFKDANDMAKYFEGKPGGTSIRMEAQWKKNEYHIHYDANGGEGEMSSQHFTGEDTSAKSKDNEFTRPGHKFIGFKAHDKDGNYLKDENGNDIIFTSPEEFIEYLHEQGDGGEITLVAQWEPLPWVKYVDEDGKTVYMDPTHFDGKEPSAPQDPTKEGYTFTGWTREVDENGNVTYTAHWEPVEEDKIWVTYVDEDGNTIYMDKKYFDPESEDEPAGPPTPTKDGYTFTGWTKEVDEKGNITYTAHWEPVPEPTIWVRYIDEDGNTIYMDKKYFNPNSAEPAGPNSPTKAGYVFMGWTKEIDENGNITYIAKWKKAVVDTSDNTDLTKYYGMMFTSVMMMAYVLYIKNRYSRG